MQCIDPVVWESLTILMLIQLTIHRDMLNLVACPIFVLFLAVERAVEGPLQDKGSFLH